MKSYKKYRVIGGMLLLCLWFFRGVIFGLINIEFSKPEYLNNFRYFWSLLVLVSVYLLTFEYREENRVKSYLILLLWSVLLFGFVYLTSSLSKMCGYVISETEYVHKTKNIKLIYRYLDCGAFDSGPFIPLLTEITPINKYLNKAKVYEESELDLNVWKKVKLNSSEEMKKRVEEWWSK